MKMQTTRVGIGNAGMACGLVEFLFSVCLSAIPLPASAGPAYASWERGIRAECQAAGRSGGDRSGCFALMMERAVAEGHLTQGQVDDCRAQEQMRQRGRQVELAAWTRCGLRNAVQASIERPRPQAQARNSGKPSVARNETEVAAAPAAPPTREATARAGTPTAPDGPRLRAPRAGESFASWVAGAYGTCANWSTNRNLGRDFCAQTLLDRGKTHQLVSDAALDTCRSEWERGPRQQSQTLAVYLCAERRSGQEQPGRSTILAMRPAPEAPITLKAQGYQRPGFVAAVHAGRWTSVPFEEADPPYLLTSLHRLQALCPDAVPQSAMARIAQRAQENLAGATKRVFSGKGSLADLSSVLMVVDAVLKSGEDCSRSPTDYAREACIAEREQALQVPPSEPAKHDVALLVQQNRCGANTKQYAENLALVPLLPKGRLGAMAWLAQEPDKAKSALAGRVYAQCRRQAGEGVAEGWCACYAKKFSGVSVSSYVSAEQLASVPKDAFVDGPSFAPQDITECNDLQDPITLWRRTHKPYTTACLASSQPVTGSFTPGLEACTYRTAWGSISLREKSCPASIPSTRWGDEPVTCQ